KIAYMSPSHFSREFHKVTGLSFKEFLNKTRVDASLKLLEARQDSIAQIAQLTGFSSESYFGYVFNNIKGVSPSKYRTKNKATK
ncbi:MAG: helix-turn-helix transcriptional regulator, partial [Clostridia bacterium]|nr:helix-turn-helix transcriptional regulator [Clostridia bacterium]